MNPEILKDLGLIVGCVGTLIGAIAKVFDERDKSKVLASAQNFPRNEQRQFPEPRRHKRSLYVSIVSLAVAALGFAFSFAYEIASQREAAQKASDQAMAANAVLLEIRKTLTRLETIGVKIDSSLGITEVDTTDYRKDLAKSVAYLIDNCGIYWSDKKRPKDVFGPCNEPDIFQYRFQYDQSKCNGFHGFACSAIPTLVVYRKPVSLELLRYDGASQSAPDLILSLPPFNGTMTFSVKNGDPFDDKSIRRGQFNIDTVDIPRANWSPTGEIRSLAETSEAQLVAMTGLNVSLGNIRIFLNGEPITLKAESATKLVDRDRIIYSYIFPKQMNP